jgi:hypothetical protein
MTMTTTTHMAFLALYLYPLNVDSFVNINSHHVSTGRLSNACIETSTITRH